MTEADRLLTLEEAGAYLHKAPKTMRDWVRTKKLKGIKIGGTWRIRASDLEAFVSAASRDEVQDEVEHTRRQRRGAK
jgi:excisionase family DNA binding protein